MRSDPGVVIADARAGDATRRTVPMCAGDITCPGFALGVFAASTAVPRVVSGSPETEAVFCSASRATFFGWRM